MVGSFDSLSIMRLAKQTSLILALKRPVGNRCIIYTTANFSVSIPTEKKAFQICARAKIKYLKVCTPASKLFSLREKDKCGMPYMHGTRHLTE